MADLHQPQPQQQPPSLPPAAGANRFSRMGGTTKDCLNFGERPETPPEIKKYRKSAILTPGTRFLHHGTAADYAAKNLGELTFGEQSERGSNNVTAADLLNHSKQSELERLNVQKAERVYKASSREPLGRTMDRHTVLPTKFTLEHQPFGVSSQSAEPAKVIIFPELNEDDLKAEAIYVKSHGSYGPGEQRRRGYDWKNIDVNSQVFGTKGKAITVNGVSVEVAAVLKGDPEESDDSRRGNYEAVQRFRQFGDQLGKVRRATRDPETRPYDTVYGRSTGHSRRTAADVIRGYYKETDLVPDIDLGKSITPGFRNIAPSDDRVYGCPSIRSDLPIAARGRRSIADAQNYGDDVPASDLINPKPFSTVNVPASTLDEPKPKEKVLVTFRKIGYANIASDVMDSLFLEGAQRESGRGADMCSLTAFRGVLNEYLKEVDNGREAAWRRARGL